MAFEPLFPIANIFSWIGIDFIQETECKEPNPTKLSLNTLLQGAREASNWVDYTDTRQVFLCTGLAARWIRRDRLT